MEDLDNITSEALQRYFTVLESVGYIKDSDTYKVLLLQFLLEFLHEYLYYITELDYNIINNILQCLAGTSCLIPYLEYIQMSLPLNSYSSVSIRITEDEIIRSTENDTYLRITN